MNLRILLIICSALLASGCGYHLRGSQPIVWNLGSVYIQQQNAANLAAEVKHQLTINAVLIKTTPTDADTIITLTHEDYERRVLSVDPDTGKVREYELTIEVGVKAVRRGGALLFNDEHITLERDFTFDETTALGKFSEESSLQAELRVDVAGVILRRLQAVHGKPVPPPSP